MSKIGQNERRRLLPLTTARNTPNRLESLTSPDCPMADNRVGVSAPDRLLKQITEKLLLQHMCTHRGSVNLFSAQDAITLLFLYIANICLLHYINVLDIENSPLSQGNHPREILIMPWKVLLLKNSET